MASVAPQQEPEKVLGQKQKPCWQAQEIGDFEDEEEAARAYDAKARKHYDEETLPRQNLGGFNFPPELQCGCGRAFGSAHGLNTHKRSCEGKEKKADEQADKDEPGKRGRKRGHLRRTSSTLPRRIRRSRSSTLPRRIRRRRSSTLPRRIRRRRSSTLPRRIRRRRIRPRSAARRRSPLPRQLLPLRLLRRQRQRQQHRQRQPQPAVPAPTSSPPWRWTSEVQRLQSSACLRLIS